MKVLSVVLDRRFGKHASAVAKSSDYHAQAVRHIRHLLTPKLAQTLACSLILMRIDGALTSTIRKLQQLQNNAEDRAPSANAISR